MVKDPKFLRGGGVGYRNRLPFLRSLSRKFEQKKAQKQKSNFPLQHQNPTLYEKYLIVTKTSNKNKPRFLSHHLARTAPGLPGHLW